ncbi:CotO family spore coat protein [Oceanobacillus kapialis]|uniref:CotO family spore coat protein n=1 Tax=Oceanobacillus kapialis TaxID=481353 RepID=A0ABW5Q1Z2_9BACI
MAKKRFAKDPLLYIHQPKENKPKAPMQHTSYTNSKKKQPLATEQEKVEQKQEEVPGPVRTHMRRRSFLEEQALQQEEQDKHEQEKKGEGKKDFELEDEREEVIEHKETEEKKEQRPKFRDMTIEEKVAYFVDTPSYAPQMRCEIRTEGKAYRGIITGSEDNFVYIRVGNRKQSTKINLDDIKHIKLLGF